jgi:hypothetical protein
MGLKYNKEQLLRATPRDAESKPHSLHSQAPTNNFNSATVAGSSGNPNSSPQGEFKSQMDNIVFI